MERKTKSRIFEKVFFDKPRLTHDVEHSTLERLFCFPWTRSILYLCVRSFTCAHVCRSCDLDFYLPYQLLPKILFSISILFSLLSIALSLFTL